MGEQQLVLLMLAVALLPASLEAGQPQVSLKVSSSIVESAGGPFQLGEPAAPAPLSKFSHEDAVAPIQHGRIQERNQPGYRRSLSSSWFVNGGPPAQPAPQRRADELRCQRRSLNRVLRGAKSLLTDRLALIEQYITPGNLMLGSSLLAAAIPLVVSVLPDGGVPGQQLNRRLGQDENGASSSRWAVQGRVEALMGWIERSVEHLPNFPRLHPQECVKRSICEAHNEPNKYGAIGFMLRLLFPATNLSSTDRMDDMDFKVINKYRHAAGYGLSRRLESNGTAPAACRDKYEDCLVSLLDVAQNLMDLFLK